MAECTREQATEARLDNVHPTLRMCSCTGLICLQEAAMHACCLTSFILLTTGLVAEAARVIGPGGRVLVMHWRSDIPTPGA